MHQPPVKNESFSENLLTAQSAFEGTSSYASLVSGVRFFNVLQLLLLHYWISTENIIISLH